MRLTILAILLLLPMAITAQVIKGRVVKIADVDTFTLLVDEHEQIKVRLDGIDAPEKGQSYGTRAKEYLSNIIWGQPVTVYVKGKDRYGRSIGKMSTPTIKDVNLEMIKGGFAWQYRDYNKDKTYSEAEEQARSSRKGLWQEKNPMRPQDYRKMKRQKK